MQGIEIDVSRIDAIEDLGPRTYVLGMTNGTVKVGFTEQPKRRLTALTREARQQSNPIVRIWLSVSHELARRSERDLITFCEQRASRPGGATSGEYFVGLSFDEVVSASENAVAVRSREVASRATGPWTDYETDEAGVWAERHPLSCESLIGEVLRGDLILVDAKTGALVDPRNSWLA